jgi:plasmid replication initiation protein
MESKKLVVTQSNHITNAAYKLTLNEQRAMLLILTKIDSMNGTYDTKTEFVITAKEFSETFDIDLKNSYHYLSEVGDSLFERKLTLPIKGKSRYIKTRWVSDVEYNEGEGQVTINIAPKMLPLLTGLRKNFTTYELSYTANFKSSYSHRVYQLLTQWKSIGKCRVDVDGLRQRLQLTPRYEQYKFLKSEILKPALAEINKHSNFTVSMAEFKKVRKVAFIEFTFSDKTAKRSNKPQKARTTNSDKPQVAGPETSSLPDSEVSKGLKKIMASAFLEFVQ